MAIGAIFEGQFTQAQYEQVLNEVCPDGAMPPGMQYHAAGATENGWCVFEVWESREAAERFFSERLNQAIQKAGVSVQAKFFDLHNIIQP